MGSRPSVQRSDPEADAQKAADKAMGLANAQTASRRRLSRNSTLLASGAQGVSGPAPTVLATAYAKETLGA